MPDISGSHWAVRLVAVLGGLLAVHMLIVTLAVPANDVGRPPYPLPFALGSQGGSGGSGNSGSDGGSFLDANHLLETAAPDGSPWYPPRATDLNNLTVALAPTTTGVYGFQFGGSEDPPGVPYGTYNWCNMPHVRRQEYVVPERARYTLKYVEVLHRHHKRTPYAANAFPHEPYRWDCDDARVHQYGESLDTDSAGRVRRPATGAYYRPVFDSPSNPFLAAAPGWKGSCQFPQLTAGGLDDAWQHGADLYGVYHDLLGVLPAADDAQAWQARTAFRVTNNPITSQTAAMVLGGMAAAAGLQTDALAAAIPLAVEPPGFDALEPQYSCPAAATLFAAITSAAPADAPAWADHLVQLEPLFTRLDAASGVDPNNPLGFHTSVDHYYDNLSARQCHGKPPVAGISQADADAVFRVGQWEYSRMYRDDGRSLAASVGAWGAWMGQLAAHLREAAAAAAAAAASNGDNDASSSSSTITYRHNVAHDGSVSRFLSILQADKMVWPGMGSEVVVELWQDNGGGERGGGSGSGGSGGGGDDAETADSPKFAVRILFGGGVLRSSHPDLNQRTMLPLETLLGYIDGLVGPDASLLPAKCNGTLPL